MFCRAAPRYWILHCHVGGTSDASAGRLFGLGCRVGSRLVLTAAHVYEKHDTPTVLLSDGLWLCSVAKEWSSLDIGLLRAERLLERRSEPNEPTVFPQLSAKVPLLGTSLGYIGWLSLLEPNGDARGRTYFGQGHVAFFERGRRGQTLLAVDGSAVERGFSGGPAFTQDGELCAVLVQALQYAPNLGDTARQLNSLPLVSPIAPIREELVALVQEA